MKAYVVHQFGGVENLKLEEMPMPEPATGEVVIKVMVAGLNPIDLNALSGGMGERVQLPVVLGVDVSGVVEMVGADVTDFSVGDEVFGMVNLPAVDGLMRFRGFAEYAAAPAAQLAKKPEGLSFETAAALPAVGLTAKQALEDVGGIQDGQRVLIHGGAGGVGHMGVQIAKLHGAYVFATASAADAAFVKSLGADEVIDYKTQNFEEVAKDVDLVLDVVGAENMRRSFNVMKPGATLVTTRWPELSKVADEAKAKGVQAKSVGVTANPAQLLELAQQAIDGKLRVSIDRTFAFAQLPEAFEHFKAGGVRGKLVVNIAPDAS